MILEGKSAEQKFAEAFAKAFMKKAEKPPETNEDKEVPAPVEVSSNEVDPGEVAEWDGDEKDQYSPDVKRSAGDTREGVLGRVFATPPSPKGQFRKVSHARPTVQERVLQLCDRR